MTISRGAHALATAALLLAAVTACADDEPGPPASDPPSTAALSHRRPPRRRRHDRQRDEPLADASDTGADLLRGSQRAAHGPDGEAHQAPQRGHQRRALCSTDLLVEERSRGRHRPVGTPRSPSSRSSGSTRQLRPDGREGTYRPDRRLRRRGGVDFLDSSGTSIISADRPDSGWIRYLVSNYNLRRTRWRFVAGRLQPGSRAPAMRRA